MRRAFTWISDVLCFFFLTGPIYHRSLRQAASNIREACVPSPAQEVCDTQLKGKGNICERGSFPCWQWGGGSPSSSRLRGSQPLFLLLPWLLKPTLVLMPSSLSPVWSSPPAGIFYAVFTEIFWQQRSAWLHFTASTLCSFPSFFAKIELN